MSAQRPTLNEIIFAVKDLIQIELRPIVEEINKMKANMVTKADIADMVIDFDHMKREQMLMQREMSDMKQEMRIRFTRIEQKLGIDVYQIG